MPSRNQRKTMTALTCSDYSTTDNQNYPRNSFTCYGDCVINNAIDTTYLDIVYCESRNIYIALD